MDSGPSGAFRGRVQTGISGFGRRVAPYRTLHVVFMFQTTESQIVQESDRLGGGNIGLEATVIFRIFADR